ncbi:4Fe-4S dicluster domain-containing protein [Minwuia thermotolerans]|uniref:Molybdopterin oxidoreductase n=1 Tax=Minwuia thermotolerans TaxID=2056226 RepID=A0A2M9G318_9PROT|nr:4Fe-4S dicluster domain-containing protein [Minwuia thermotolerans]PJK30103.1 molybdopterin oxidoreductase [Minwuia thermotolerans]
MSARDDTTDPPDYWRSPGGGYVSSPMQAGPDAPGADPTPPVDRRGALKLLAGGVSLAGLAACEPAPEEEIVPRVTMPEYDLPGRPTYYATALELAGYGMGLLGETHSGRPTRLEGNPDHPLNGRATDAFAQAAILDLYDPGRSQAVLQRGDVSTWDDFAVDLAASPLGDGAGVRLLTGRVGSPSLLAAIERFLEYHPRARWHVHEPVGRTAAADGAKIAFGERLEAVHRLDGARVILSLDCDFLSPEEPAHLKHARDFAAARRVSGPDGDPPARLYAVESTPALAGAAAEHRLPVRADRIEALTRGLAQRLGIAVAAHGLTAGEQYWLDAVVRDLESHPGRAPVLAGVTQPPAVHALVCAINRRLGNDGRTVGYIAPVAAEGQGGLAELARDMEAGAVGTLIMLETNPVHTAPADIPFGRLLAERVERSIHWGQQRDETAVRARWHAPASHPLESWGDVRDFLGHVTLQQPLIRPLHRGRTALQFMAALEGEFDADPRLLLMDYWRERGLDGDDFDTAWRSALRQGVVDGTAEPWRTPALRSGFIAELPSPKAEPEALVLQFRADPAAFDGRFVHNPWLQELPRPLSKLVWANPALISPSLAARLKVENGDVVRLEVGGSTLEAPVWVLPGQPDEAVTLTLGYGRAGGPLDRIVGVDAYRLRTSGAEWVRPGVRIAPTGERRPLASTQHHHEPEGRGIVRRADWAEFVADPDFAHAHRKPPETSLYPEPVPGPAAGSGDGAGPQWGMVIDFDACIGCNACVAACQAENNIPVVGPEEVARGREMHWLRIDRYHAGPAENPDTVFQPVPCMHCENAPCEYVCPVEATVHGTEGLNEMVYNRCIGTRYCSQNCPYKVRRFNWFDYAGPDAGIPTPAEQKNPGVTVRARGVMEKCTYCVQRISRARIAAKREDRPIPTDAVRTACQDACPAEAIIFGDVADPQSEVSRWKADPRNYGMLEELNTRPRTTYVAGVRHPNPELDGDAGNG